MPTPTALPSTFTANTVLPAASLNLLRGGFRVLQVIAAATTSVKSAKSVNIGCVRMTERHFAHDPAQQSQVDAARADIVEAIAKAASIVPITKAKTLIAVAGTATTVAAAALNLSEYDRYAIHLSRITAQQVHDL